MKGTAFNKEQLQLKVALAPLYLVQHMCMQIILMVVFHSFDQVMESGTLRNGMPLCIPHQSGVLQWKVLKKTLWMRELL